MIRFCLHYIIVMNTSISLPEYDEHQWQLDQEYTFPFNIDSIKYKSPTLPLHFDKAYLPKHLCEPQLLNASQCLLQHTCLETQKSEMCAFELSQFEVCRRHRDLRILQGIKAWQTQHVRALDRQNRGMYQMGLNRKVARLEEEMGRQPSTIKGIERAKNLQAEIKEMRWRLDYIGAAVADDGLAE